MEPFEIGTVSGDDLYAGPKYGWVDRDKYNELLQDGSLGRGQQTVEMTRDAVAGTVGKWWNAATGAWEEKVGTHIPDIEPNEQVKGALSTTADIAGKAWEFSGLQQQVDQTMMLLDVPVQGIHWASKKLDPTGRGIGTGPLGITEALLTLGAGSIKSGGKGLLKHGDEIVEGAVRTLTGPRRQYAYATALVDDGTSLLKSGPLTANNQLGVSTAFQAKVTATASASAIPIPKDDQLIWRSGAGSRGPNTTLKDNVGEWLQTKFKETDKGLSFDKRKRLINRKDFGNIADQSGEAMEISGVGSYLKSVEAGKPNPNLIKIQKVSTRQKNNLARLERMRAPEKELYEYAAANGIPKADIDAYLKEYSSGFNRVQKAASLNTKLGDPSDAGHWISTMSSTGPNALDRAATSTRAARIENRFLNRSAGADIGHDMNQYAAEIVGIPRNWKEDLILFLDQRKGGPNRLPNWMADFQGKDLDALLAIPPNASKAEVEAVFDDLVKGWRKDRNHWSNQMKSIQRELKVDKSQLPSDNPDYYLYGKQGPEYEDILEGTSGAMTKAERTAYDKELLTK